MTVSPASLLHTWEHASRMVPVARPVALLALAKPGAQADALAKLPLGIRDAHLLRLRQALFGDVVECLTSCPACGGELEFGANTSEFLREAGEEGTDEFRWDGADHRICFRLLNSADLIELSHSEYDAGAFEAAMLPRCIVQVEGPDGPLEPSTLPPAVIDLLAREMERRDPLAVIWLDLECGHCRHAWQSLFDIASLLWADVDRWARGLLFEVHVLARAYGWTERDVLQLSPARRAYYLGMVGS